MAHDWNSDLVSYLRDAHAMEEKSLQTLEAAIAVAGDPQLQSIYDGHIMETQHHLELLKHRLETHDSSRSLLKASSAFSVQLDCGLRSAPATRTRWRWPARSSSTSGRRRRNWRRRTSSRWSAPRTGHRGLKPCTSCR